MKKRRIWFRRVCLLAVIALLLMLASECWLVPLLTAVGEHRSQSFYRQTVSDIVADVMEETGISGEHLVKVQTNANGTPAVMTADTALLNRLSAELNRRLSEELRELDEISFSVPIGSVFGGVFAAHRGPSVTFRLTADEIISVTVEESIVPAGINQTCYSLSVTVEQNMLLLYAGRYRTLSMSSTVPLTQTVLFGAVPDTFATWGE